MSRAVEFAPAVAILAPLMLAPLAFVLSRRARVIAPLLAGLASATALVVGAACLVSSGSMAVVGAPWRGGVAASESMRWLSSSAGVLALGYRVDALAALMLVVVGSVALCVVVFSVGYLEGDPGWSRYFSVLCLFVGSMALLVSADGFVALFMGWELVGACSYLLIGFWYERPRAVRAAIKAFLTTRVGDVSMLAGIALLWREVGSLEFTRIASAISSADHRALSLAAVLLALGAMGKSAQFPLHAWLPDAMEGPTPVSALIHAATMVAAGVFLVVRIWPLFDAAPAARLLLLAAGAISAFGAALIATVQRDIKKVLAYSTISQLGFMFAALGAGAPEVAFFHLVTHAAFKGLLFLTAGSVIHGAGTQDLHRMGGLRRVMPLTFGAWLVGAFALAGIPPLSGFFSKDALLEHMLSVNPLVGITLMAASMLTAFYVARTTRLAFFGPYGADSTGHESPLVMTLPLIALSVPAAFLGFAQASVSRMLGVEPEHLVLSVAFAALAVAALGGIAGWKVSNGGAGDTATRRTMGVVGDALFAAFGWDRLIALLVTRPVVAVGRATWAFGDRLLIDGAVEGAAEWCRASGRTLRRLQNGDLPSYAAYAVLWVALALGVVVWVVAS